MPSTTRLPVAVVSLRSRGSGGRFHYVCSPILDKELVPRFLEMKPTGSSAASAQLRRHRSDALTPPGLS